MSKTDRPSYVMVAAIAVRSDSNHYKRLSKCLWPI